MSFFSDEHKITEYAPIVPTDRIHIGVTADNISTIVDRQRAACETDSADKRAVVVLDDSLTSQAKVSALSPVIFNSRHMALNTFIIMQYPLTLGPEARCNVDYVFICRTEIVKERKEIYKQYAGMFPSFEKFCQVMDACTDNYECLVIDNMTSSMNIEDMIYWYKAKSHEDFVIGAGDDVRVALLDSA